MTHSLTRRTFLSRAGAGLAAGALAGNARAAEGPTPDQMLDELIQQNQDSGIGSGFDNASRNVKLPKKSAPGRRQKPVGAAAAGAACDRRRS